MKTQVADFTLDAKAQSVEIEDDGTVIIEGYASDHGVDRQNEAFLPGAFEEGIKGFMENPVLLFHHKFDKALGRVLELDMRDQGLWMKAAIDPPSPGSWAEDVVNKVKRGTIRGLSVGGKFYRSLVNGAPKIHKADLAEISVTPLPINQRTLFAVAGKAFENQDESDLKPVTFEEVSAGIASVEANFDAILERLSQRTVVS